MFTVSMQYSKWALNWLRAQPQGTLQKRGWENVRIRSQREGLGNTIFGAWCSLCNWELTTAARICPRPTQGGYFCICEGPHPSIMNCRLPIKAGTLGVTVFSCGPTGGWTEQALTEGSKPVVTQMAPTIYSGSQNKTKRSESGKGTYREEMGWQK